MLLNIKIAAALLVAILAFPAYGQQPAKQPVDSRIASELVEAQAAEIALANKLIAVLREDIAKREREWAGYCQSLWRQPDGAEPSPAKPAQ